MKFEEVELVSSFPLRQNSVRPDSTRSLARRRSTIFSEFCRLTRGYIMTEFNQSGLDFRHTEFIIVSLSSTTCIPWHYQRLTNRRVYDIIPQEPYIKQHIRLKLDADNIICKDFLSPITGCTKGVNCPLRHIVTLSPLNFLPPTGVPTTSHAKTVCKHWLRGLCKKGNSCEFMHEYHLRKMPECWFFAKYGFCSNGDECMYLHVTQDMRIRECPQYRKGFCRLGEFPVLSFAACVCIPY